VHYPKDSLRTVTEGRANAWLEKIQRPMAAGSQADPYITLAAAARSDTAAQRLIAARLATPALSGASRAYTLFAAVSLFATPESPERLPVAERYMQQLDALGPKAAYWQFGARKALIAAYYRLGRSSDVIRVGTQAFALVPHIPFELRSGTMYNAETAFEYAAVVDALGGQANARTHIRALNAALMAAAVPPAVYVTRDSFFTYIGERNVTFMREQAAMAERVGEQGTPLVANYWINRGATHDSQTVAVTDGKIRVIQIGSWTCLPCVAAIPALERLHQRYPAVEFNFMTWGEGTWGNRVVAPDVEAVRLAEHFVKKLGATFPIGIALANRLVPTEDGGQRVERSTPTWNEDNYPQASKPTFYILDGTGKVRHVIGGYARDLDENIASVLAFLQQEAQSPRSQSVVRPSP
jgi:thiol-disulfide isomerase/thioredoxin